MKIASLYQDQSLKQRLLTKIEYMSDNLVGCVAQHQLQSVTKIIETHYIFIKKSTKRH